MTSAFPPLVALVLAGGCAADPPAAVGPEAWMQPHAPWYDPVPEPPMPVRFRDPAAARYHMRAHFDDLRMVEQLLVAGKLEEGLTLAYLLTRKIDDPGLAAWDGHARNVVDAAMDLTKAAGLDDALRREARLAAECAGCHAATQARVTFAPAPLLPPDRRTPQTIMARHVWAVDRLWEGLIGPDETRWSRGLAVLAESPLPFTPLAEARAFAADVQRLARVQLDTRATTLLDDRGAAYGEILVRCAACHAALHANLQ